MLRTLNIRITIAVVPPTTITGAPSCCGTQNMCHKVESGPELITIGNTFGWVSHLWFVLAKDRGRAFLRVRTFDVQWASRGNFSVLALEFSGNHVKRKRKRDDRYPAVAKTTSESYLRSSEARRNRETVSCVRLYHADKSIAATSHRSLAFYSRDRFYPCPVRGRWAAGQNAE